MTRPWHDSPPFDPQWLDTLADVCRALASQSPRLVDLFLERRLDLRVSSLGGHLQTEEGRSDGAAVRWRFPSRTVLHAQTGTSPAAVDDLLSSHSRRSVLPKRRRLEVVEIEPPQGWRDWAAEVLRHGGGGHQSVRFVARSAAVVRPGRWAAAKWSPLVRVEANGGGPSALLSVWGHPRLGAWLGEVFEPPAGRRWRPDVGLRLPVMFTAGTAGVVLHEAIGHLAESDLVIAGDSPLSDQLGANITIPGMRVVDDPTRRDLPGGFTSDDEGVVAKPRPLVDEGRLVGWLSDRAGAATLGPPAGRGRRASWRRPPVARLSNLVVSPGGADPGAMENGLDHGLLVTRVGGATVDPVTGRMVLRVERGWEVRRGRRRRPTDGFELTGGVLDVLAHVDPAVGSDPTSDWRLGWCVKDGIPLPTGSEAPSMIFHNLEVL
jgi:hypothetical protein